MAKKRFFKRRTARIGTRKAYRRSGKSSENVLNLALGAAIYGFGRPYLEKAIAPITDKIPLGGYADEVVLGTVGYFAAKGKLGSNSMIKNIGKAMLVIEAARIGANVGGNIISSTNSGSSTNWYDAMD